MHLLHFILYNVVNECPGMFDHQLKALILNMAFAQKYESVAWSEINTEFNFYFHVRKLEADY